MSSATELNNHKEDLAVQKKHLFDDSTESSKVTDNSRFLRIKVTMIMMVLIIIASVFIILLYTNTIEDIKTSQAQNIESHKEEQFDQLWDILIDHIMVDAKSNITEPAKNIESEIRNMNMESLKNDLDNGYYSDDLVEVFRSNLVDVSLNGVTNGRNNTLVISNDQIIVNYSYYVYPTTAENPNLFSNIVIAGYNSKLGYDAVDKLYKHDDTIICTETLCENSKTHIKIAQPTKDNLKMVYMSEGLDGLRNYQFLVPIYITDTGDIFGQDDIVFGERNDSNHKFIIIQEFNLYDQLVEEYDNYFDNSYMHDLEYRYQIILRNSYTLGIFFIVFVVLVLFIFISIYNNFIYGYLLALQKNKK